MSCKPDQAMSALKHANTIRLNRARLKRAIKNYDITLTVLLGPPCSDSIASLDVLTLLTWLPGWGPRRALTTIRGTGISPVTTVSHLTSRQRDELLKKLDGR